MLPSGKVILSSVVIAGFARGSTVSTASTFLTLLITKYVAWQVRPRIVQLGQDVQCELQLPGVCLHRHRHEAGRSIVEITQSKLNSPILFIVLENKLEKITIVT